MKLAQTEKVSSENKYGETASLAMTAQTSVATIGEFALAVRVCCTKSRVSLAGSDSQFASTFNSKAQR